MKLTGIVGSGIGQGAQFLALDWVQSQLRRHLDLTPFPGTLNIRVAPAVRDELFAQRERFLRIADPASPDCPGYLKKVTLHAHGRFVDVAWVILPEKTMHTDVIEVISTVNLRQHLALNDGDSVDVEMT
jgi:riboflavin kinase